MSDTVELSTLVFVRKRIIISSAELLAIHDTPKILVAAPGSNKVILLGHIVVTYKFVTTPYTPDGGDGNAAGYGWGSNASTYFRYGGWNNTMLDSTESKILVEAFNTSGDGLNLSLFANQPLIFADANVNWVGGDGVVVIDFEYCVLDFS